MDSRAPRHSGFRSRLAAWAPGLLALGRYRLADLPHDVAGGIAVAAVTVPVSIANARLAGLPPENGLYASILPLVVYAVLGTSPQLIVGTSAAAAALVASAIGTLAAGDPSQHLSIAMMLALLVGLMCLSASALRLGAIADFLSRPIVVGFMNGLALSILLGQLGPLFGIALTAEGFFPRVLEFMSRLPDTHLPTLVVGGASLGVILAASRLAPRIPAALLGMLVAGVVVKLFALQSAGVGLIGVVPAGLPALSMPIVPLHYMPVLLAEAAGLTLLSFSSTMLAARSFAEKNRYDLDPDREIAALGAANVAAALSQSFAVTGSGLRTAAAEASGARTQVAGLVAAGALVPVLLFLTGPLQYIPSVALAAILISAATSMLNWDDLRAIHRIEPQEFWLAMIATAGVLVFGAIDAILLVVVLALLRFVRLTARPRVEILGELEGDAGYQSVARHPEARAEPGLLMLRYNGPIVFFSAPHFKREVLAAAAAAGPGLRWFVIDLLPVSQIDATGLFAIRDVLDALRARGVVVAAAGRDTEWADRAARRDLSGVITGIRFFPTLRRAELAYREEVRDSPVAP
ncbi:MAG: SulP family inorganic anion transporter [Gammaproteobacteria bacterium]|nr:SulP family inorganic anion transporter [Gammaproteobacteria bacterium]